MSVMWNNFGEKIMSNNEKEKEEEKKKIIYIVGPFLDAVKVEY